MTLHHSEGILEVLYDSMTILIDFINLIEWNQLDFHLFEGILEVLGDSMTILTYLINLIELNQIDFHWFAGEDGLQWWSPDERLAVMTRGAASVICATRHGVRHLDVTPTPAQNIRDTTGAGDAFLAGFLSQLMTDARSLHQCVLSADRVAKIVIGQTGCHLPWPLWPLTRSCRSSSIIMAILQDHLHVCPYYF